MPTSRLVRWGAVGGVIAGAAWIVSHVLTVLLLGQEDDSIGSASFYLTKSADAISEAGMLAALIGLHVVQVRSFGNLGRMGFVAACSGTVLALVSTLWSVFLLDRFGTMAPSFVFRWGLICWLVGFVFFGIATFRAGVLPRWSGLLLLAYPIVMLIGLPTGGPVLSVGIMWLALAYAMWKRKDTIGEQTSRVA